MKSIDVIEHHHNTSLPNAYKDWVVKGYTNYRSNPELYLWVNEAEWIPPEDILARDLWRENILPGIVPFAFTGAGDNWCFNTCQKTDENEYEILACWHDEEEADLYAPNFKAWFYRTCLEYAALVENDLNEIGEARENLGVWSEKAEELGCKKWAEHLKELSAIAPFEYQDPNLNSGICSFGFITSMDVEKIICLEMGDKYNNSTVKWGWYDD